MAGGLAWRQLLAPPLAVPLTDRGTISLDDPFRPPQTSSGSGFKIWIKRLTGSLVWVLLSLEVQENDLSVSKYIDQKKIIMKRKRNENRGAFVQQNSTLANVLTCTHMQGGINGVKHLDVFA